MPCAGARLNPDYYTNIIETCREHIVNDQPDHRPIRLGIDEKNGRAWSQPSFKKTQPEMLDHARSTLLRGG